MSRPVEISPSERIDNLPTLEVPKQPLSLRFPARSLKTSLLIWRSSGFEKSCLDSVVSKMFPTKDEESFSDEGWPQVTKRKEYESKASEVEVCFQIFSGSSHSHNPDSRLVIGEWNGILYSTRRYSRKPFEPCNWARWKCGKIWRFVWWSPYTKKNPRWEIVGNTFVHLQDVCTGHLFCVRFWLDLHSYYSLTLLCRFRCSAVGYHGWIVGSR